MDLVLQPSRRDVSTQLLALQEQLARWLCEAALPLWDQIGVDRVAGGFFETLHFDAISDRIEAAGVIRRGRVVARQIYVFEVGRRFGWYSPRTDPISHGCEYLLDRLWKSDGLFHTSIPHELGQASFSLYEHAFYLFALARAHRAGCNAGPLNLVAASCLQQLRSSFGNPAGGFEESRPPTLPLRSNPHMHLLEAALAWIEASGGSEQALWAELADELVTLCLTRFIATKPGAVAETFDAEWQPWPDGNDRLVIEPGHQFEWAWLLAQWSALEYCTPLQRVSCDAAIKHLTHLAETWGVDRVRGVAVNELWDDLSVKDGAAKVWPQTERIKAWCVMLRLAEHEHEIALAGDHLITAIRSLLSYLHAAPHGLWAEVLSATGDFSGEPCKASSFYHIVGAIEALQATLGALPAFNQPLRRISQETTHEMAFSS